MNMNLIQRVTPITPLTRSKHSTQDPNERRRRQLLLAYGYSPKAGTIKDNPTFGRVLRDTVEISDAGRAFLASQNRK